MGRFHTKQTNLRLIGEKQRQFFSAALALLFFTCGCTKVGPDFHRPDVSVSQDWMESGNPSVKKEAYPDYRNWWKAFNDPVLDGLLERAYRENLTLRMAGTRVLQARAELGIATGGFYPQTQQATGSVEYIYAGRSSAGQSSGPTSGFLTSRIGVMASWELDFWGKFRRAIESADAGLLSSLADYDNTLVTLTADVANSYITVRTLEKRLQIANENVSIQKESLRIAESKFQYGNISQLDVEQAKTLLNNTLATIPSLQTQLQQARNALSILLGMPPSDLGNALSEAAGIPLSPDQVVVGIPLDLLRRRPDVRRAEYQAMSQSARIGVAKADLYPSFSLTGNFSLGSSNIGASRLVNMFTWNNRSFQAGSSFGWNIFNYGRITNNVRLQDALFQELLFAYQNAVLSAQQDVEDNLTAFLKGRERAGLLAISTASAKTALDLAVRQYREGIKDFTTVLSAQQALLNEQDSLATTLGGIASSLVGVYRSLGGGWEIREGRELIPAPVKEEMAKRTNWGRLLDPRSYNPQRDLPESRVRTPDW